MDEQIKALRADFEKVTGKTFKRFYCPIMHEDREDVELIDGHIVPQAIKKASRATVIQRKDVDNYFGTTLENDMINHVNLHTLTTEEAFAKVYDLKLVQHPDGELVDAFHAPKNSNPPFPPVKLQDEDGITYSLYIKPNPKWNPECKQYAMQGSINMYDPAIAGSYLKAGHLALFRLLGYQWVFCEAGLIVASTLRKFFGEKGTRTQAGRYFSAFKDIVHALPPGRFVYDTIDCDSVVFHFDDSSMIDESGIRCKTLWGLSTLFHLNDHTFMTTLPITGLTRFPSDLMSYGCYTTNWKIPHKGYGVKVRRENGRTSFGIHNRHIQFEWLSTPEYRKAMKDGADIGWPRE